MNQGLIQTQAAADLFAIELDRVVSDFVENATDEDVERLLARASEGFESKIETPSVIKPSEATFYLQGSICLRSIIRRVATPCEAGAADRNDLALAA